MALEPIMRFDALTGKGWDKDVLVIGKRKPFLSSRKDAAKIQRYVDAYWALVEKYRTVPGADPD
jgi:hypothetical protein